MENQVDVFPRSLTSWTDSKSSVLISPKNSCCVDNCWDGKLQAPSGLINCDSVAKGSVASSSENYIWRWRPERAHRKHFIIIRKSDHNSLANMFKILFSSSHLMIWIKIWWIIFFCFVWSAKWMPDRAYYEIISLVYSLRSTMGPNTSVPVTKHKHFSWNSCKTFWLEHQDF
jgi:hypothetical protein